jgi:hypothetical protein
MGTFWRMPAEARVTRTWVQQKGLIPVFLIGCSLWFLWDGFIGYPRSNERWDAHESRKAAPGEWEKYCTERGWKTEPPHRRFEHTDIVGQYVFAGLTGVMGIFSLIYWQRVRRSVLRSDDETVVTPSGARVPYASITSVDQRKWKSKGLATVYYTIDGAKRRFVLDDAKYEPEGLDVILEDILKRTGGETGVK